MKLPQKRHDVLYVRVSQVNKKWLQDLAERKSVSISVLVDAILDEANDGKGKLAPVETKRARGK